MTDLDSPVRQQLELLVPPTRTAPDWDDVVARLRPARRRRPVVLAFAAALAVLVTGAGVTAALGGFDRWLAGKPGKPAAAADQARFRAANGRSWASFPTGTKLRQLIDTTIDGRRYVLFGFRSGNALCLKLRAVTLGHTLGPECTPASMVANLEAPILAVVPSNALSDRHNHPSAEFSYGIVADGVSRVDVRAVDGVHRALIGGNAYLWVENEPNTGNFVTRVTATGPGSHVTSLPISPSRFGAMGLVKRSVPGPTRIEARIPHPAIGWYERREKRGLSIDQAKLTPQQREELRRFDKGFTRLVKPDPLSNLVVGLSGHLCLLVVGGGTTCSKTSDFFGTGSMNVSLFSPDGRSFFVAGAAPDGVARIELFTSDGVRQRVPLKDNLFTAIVGAQQGARVVGYDARGRVVAVQTFGGFGQIAPPTGAFQNLHVAVTALGPNGATGTIRVGPVLQQLRCWKAAFSTGQSQTGCKEEFATGPFTEVDSVQPAGRDLFVIGHVRAPVASVRLRFADGSSVGAKPVDGMYLFAIPSSQLSPTRQLAFVIGYDAGGKRVQRQGVLFKTSG